MKLAIAALAAALLWTAPAMAQDGTATPAKGTAATPPRDTRPSDAGGQTGVTIDKPKIDPKLIVDIFKQLTKPKPRPAPPAPAPVPVAPAPAVVAAPAPAPPPPAAVAPPPRPVPAAAPAAPAPRAAKPAPAPAAKPPPPPAPVVAAEPLAPVEPVVAPTAEPAARAPRVIPAVQAHVPQPIPAAPAQRNSSLLAQSPWLLLALLAAAAAIGAAALWSRARQIARTRAALSLDPRLDLAEGSCSTGRLALACPPMSIRTRLEFGNA